MMEKSKLRLPVVCVALLVATAACSDDTADLVDNSTGGVAAVTGGMVAMTGGMADGTGGTTAETGGMAEGSGGEQSEPMSPGDIVEVAVAAGNFTKLAEALTAAGLVDALKANGPFTVFAPTDAAFAAFESENPGVLAGLSTEELTAILTYHVVPAKVMSTDLQDGQLAESLNGTLLAVDLSDGVKINGVTVSAADVAADNGVIHAVDAIIMPPGDIIEVAVGAGEFGELAGALTAAGLVETLQGEGPFTVFAPTDAAFAALSAVPSGDALTEVLLYHVLEGVAGPRDLVSGGVAQTVSGLPVIFDLADGAKVNESMITMTNVVASNGVIHVIDAVLLPPTKDIVETAIDAGVFTTLAGALTSQDLVETLQGEGPFTVFAPTDDAFAALTAVPSGDALTNVLLYHVADGAVGSGNLEAGPLEMLSGDSVTIQTSPSVLVDDAAVTTANVLTRNGVIHIIDTVLVP